MDERRFLLDGDFIRGLHEDMAEVSLHRALAELRERAPEAPRSPELLDWGRRALGLDDTGLDDWYDRAWWGCAASFAVMLRLNQGRFAEVDAVMDPVEREPLDRLTRRGKGVVLVTPHVGPSLACRYLFHRWNLPLMTLTSNNRFLKSAFIDPTKPGMRNRSLAVMARFLRQGGCVLTGPDGHLGSDPLWTSFLGQRIRVYRGTPRLVDATGAPALWAAALWRGNRIAFDLAEIPPAQGPDPVRRDGQWIAAFLAKLEEVYRREPENLRLEGGFWTLEPGCFFPPAEAAPA